MITNPLKHRRVAIPVLALALVAVAAPAASGYTVRPNPDEAALIAASQSGQAATQAPAVRPNPDEAALIAASQSGQAATQAPAVRPNPDELGNGPRSVSAPEFAALTRPQRAESSGSFDWGDAGIGAGVVVALSVLGIGTMVLLSGRRQRTATTG